MLFTNPRVLPALLLCIGIGVILVRGQELKTQQSWNPADIDTAVELNFALDLARQGPDIQLTEEQRRERKQEIRREIEETFIEPQRKARAEYEQGFWLAGAGLILMIVVVVLQQKGIIKK